MPPSIIIVGRHRPHEISTLVFCLLAGLVFAAGVADSGALDRMGGWAPVWAVALAVSAAVALLGAFWRGAQLVGLPLEQSGLLFNAAAIFMYAASVYSYAGNRSLFTVGICLTWIWGHMARVIQIRNDLRSLRGARSAGATS